ncbi:protein ECT2-like isoform X1 [Anguilla rostrata]|uniref:protein ECT2-like isoform X1 n=1 Tax=Anguilla rostrata TaxID=7938 RepID=UPI0030D31C4D
MAGCSTMSLGMAHNSLLDSSVFDSRMADTSLEHSYLSITPGDICLDGDLPQVETQVVLVGDAGKNEELVEALQAIKVMEVPGMIEGRASGIKSNQKLIESIVNMDVSVPCIKTEKAREVGTVFVLTDFGSPEYGYLYENDSRIVGPPVVLHCARTEEPLPFSWRPLYSNTMRDLKLCFTGFRRKEEVVHLVSLVHHMGGIIRKDFSSKVTHVVARSTHSEKYRLAVCMGTPILTPDWIYKAWGRRDEVGFGAGDEEFRSEFKIPPFQDCTLCFLGFPEEEKRNMEERTLMHGGHFMEVGEEKCTHLVVEENSVTELPSLASKRVYIVKQEWFWGCIQMDARAEESMYLYEKPGSPVMQKCASLLSLDTPRGHHKKRRLRDALAQLTRETEASAFPPCKRLSLERPASAGSLLDVSNTPESGGAPREHSRPSKNGGAPAKTSARWQVSKELYQTERNYVDILTSILQLFKLPLEKEGQVGGPILAQEEIKTIFGSIPDIYDVHTRIKADLENLLIDWSEEKSVGDIILKYSKDLAKAYPQFINFFEMSKETIVRCERLKPRFHAFLKINQAKPECGRQTLAELLIRPVQRLPSVVLLLNDIKKHTPEDNPDKVTLEKAVESLKEVMTHINEDKRKTEGQKQIFDVVYEVDGCPANLLSSHRSLVGRVDTVALGDRPCDRGDHVTLFLFSDCLEIARKRHRGIGTFRGPSSQTHAPAPLKHVALMPLSQIRRVLDLRETEECQNAFALLVHLPTEQDHQLFSFQLAAADAAKAPWLRTLCRQVANTICRADADVLIRCADPDSLQVSTKDMDSTLSRASRAIKKTSKKVTKALSLNKMPKRELQRALTAGGCAGGHERRNEISDLHSPSMVDLPSVFERKYLSYSRSTSHLL